MILLYTMIGKVANATLWILLLFPPATRKPLKTRALRCKIFFGNPAGRAGRGAGTGREAGIRGCGGLGSHATGLIPPGAGIVDVRSVFVRIVFDQGLPLPDPWSESIRASTRLIRSP